jgi:putative oxidoreductase
MTPQGLSAAVARCYKSFGKIASYAQSPFLLLVRLYWGWQFAQKGWGKLRNLPQITTFFASLNLPFPAFTAHFVAGI